MPHHPTQAGLSIIILMTVVLFFKVVTKSELREQLDLQAAKIENARVVMDSLNNSLDAIVLELDTLQDYTETSIDLQKSVRARVSTIKIGVNTIKNQTSETLNFLDKKE